MCMHTYPAAVPRAMSHMRGPERPASTSLMMVAPASTAASATSAWRVSMESGTRVSRASARITGSTRASSSSTVTGAAPGRVDSPPRSRMSAPSETSASP